MWVVIRLYGLFNSAAKLNLHPHKWDKRTKKPSNIPEILVVDIDMAKKNK